MENWKLNNVDDIEFTKDKSGIYVLINWDVKTNTVRLDIMSDDHEPLQSFAGTTDNVRKHVIRWLSDNIGVAAKVMGRSRLGVSLQHAAYIGSELEKADTMRIDYIQDGAKTVTSDNPYDVPASKLLEQFTKDNQDRAERIIRKYPLLSHFAKKNVR